MDHRTYRVGRHVVNVILSAAVCARVFVQFIVAQMSGRLVKLFIQEYCGAQM